MKLLKDPVFFERYAHFRDYGFGCMLVYWTGSTLEYVQFSYINSFKKEVINKELLVKYKKEILAVDNA